MYRCESWTIKRAEHWRIDTFELWCWRRLLRINPLDCKKIQPVNPIGNQPWLFIGRTDAEIEAPILCSWEELTHWKRPWCWERLRAGGEGGDRGWDGWMASPTQWTCVWANSGRMKDREAWRAAVHRVAKSWTQFSNWKITWLYFPAKPSLHSWAVAHTYTGSWLQWTN